ncbi:hypothetical protein VNO78_32311 [Psophocarpus tetragonolobus]|uniref:Late embryogenesis abundant protein LEA-2 subgroup domain-containing protein n=1 Tax=Psophocarpus tetragonolobus TaxID=3891 RepID=A0AAN9NVB5_PSOTE
MHAKSDSDVTSMDTSSSPKRAVYYVQSPSRDSQDGDKSYTMQASPVDSPSHHSRASSSSRVSGSYTHRKSKALGWHLPPPSKVIQEDDDDLEAYYGPLHPQSLSPFTQICIALSSFSFLFTLFCFIIAAASTPFKPSLTLQSLTVHNFYFGEGSDITGVPTKMLTVNCSLRMTVHNPATFFGIHVSSKAMHLMYSEITVATGELKKHYQPRKSTRMVLVNLQGSKVPLYGAGASLTGLVDNGKIPMTLLFEVRSRGNVVGKLVRSKHRRRVSCSVAIDSHNNKPIKLKENACTYN